MHDVVLVELLKSLEQLPEDNEGLGFFEHLLLIDQTLKSTAVAVLVHKVEVVGGLQGLDEPDDVLVPQR
jgi:hypothetical protein